MRLPENEGVESRAMLPDSIPVGTAPPPYFCFTLDTEPDDLWQPPGPLRFEHYRRLLGFHEELVDRGVRPVYFTTSEVAEDRDSSAVMRKVLAKGQAELGAHFHTWTRRWPFPVPDLGSPPLQAMAHQLGPDIEEGMLEYTCGSLERHLGIRPASYRGGRWSLGSGSIRALRNCGIRIDSTITPGRNWRDSDDPLVDGPDYRSFPRYPFFLREGSLEPHPSGDILEVPVGAAPVPFSWPLAWPRHLVRSLIRRPVSGERANPGWAWLRPTSMSTPQLRACLHQLRRDEVPVWVAMIHSSEIVPCSPLRTEAAVLRFRRRCLRLVEDAQALGATCLTLSQVGRVFGWPA